jgi:hypothetical protein
MIDRTELDARFLNHAASVAHADRFGALYPVTCPTRRGPRRLAGALLLRLSVWLAPEQGRQAIASDASA